MNFFPYTIGTISQSKEVDNYLRFQKSTHQDDDEGNKHYRIEQIIELGSMNHFLEKLLGYSDDPTRMKEDMDNKTSPRARLNHS